MINIKVISFYINHKIGDKKNKTTKQDNSYVI